MQELAVIEGHFDDLLQRFEAALAREKRFAAQASHELRTPLTLARAELESFVSRGTREPEPIRALAALSRLEKLVEVLLWFARAQGRLDAEGVDLVNIADLIAEALAELGRRFPSTRFVAHFPDEALVRGEERLLRRAIDDLLDNAVDHGTGTTVDIELIQDGADAALSVYNDGQMLSEAARIQVFEPFFRCGTSKDGFGLGLPFARAVARAHGGDVEMTAGSGGRIVARMRIPLVSWNESAAEPTAPPVV